MVQTWRAVILAAGLGTRMKSRIPKVLHPLCGIPLVQHVVDQVRLAALGRPVVVVPAGSQDIQHALGDDLEYALQKIPKGTGDALLAARHLLEGQVKHILSLYGDTPLLTANTLRALISRHHNSHADITLLTSTQGPQEGLGRVVRDGAGRVMRIVEERDASEEQRQIREVNAGVYCFSAEALWTRLAQQTPSPKGELYLTDLVAFTIQAGGRVETVEAKDGWETLGVNTRADLAQAEGIMRERIRHSWMLAGVTLVDPASTFIDSTVDLGSDTVILPNTHLYGNTQIGAGCRLGPNTIIIDSSVGEECRVVVSMLEGATLESKVDVGPFSHLRPEAYVERGVHIGNFVEIKASRLGPGTRIGHFSYIGDAILGPGVNIGAGTVTCNFDGVTKHPTIIEEGALIGSDTMLVAPVRVGNRAVTGAGSVVTRDVDADSLVVGVPARPRSQKRIQRRREKESGA